TFTTQLQTGALMMTPEYASPEQVRNELITTASDVYSLGVVLYELLTGQLPYRFKGHSLPELLQLICEDDPERPSESAGQTGESLRNFGENKTERLRAQLRGELDQIVMAALQKDVQLRYGSVEQLSEDIRRHLEGRPILARQASWRYRTEKFLRRYKLGATLSALLLLTLFGGAVATVWQARLPECRRKSIVVWLMPGKCIWPHRRGKWPTSGNCANCSTIKCPNPARRICAVSSGFTCGGCSIKTVSD
ncbi:MAG TPA: protein kinase, partial [Blastocatellia bacterium]|nr:protein kinase [Blastocatellia bacterium]